MKTVQRYAVIITAILFACTILFLGCPQKIDGGPSGGAQSGPDPNLRIEGGVLKGWNETPPTVLNVPAGVTEIAANAFSGCTSLTSVNLPVSLKTIGYNAFNGCMGITALDFSACTQSFIINDYAFNGCTGITALDFSACTQSFVINKYAFYGCTGLTGQVRFSSGLTAINYAAFWGCNKVSNFDFSQCTQLTEIGSIAFYNCTAATYKVKKGSPIRNLLLNSGSGITASQISEE